MTALAGVDLDGRRAGRADALGVIGGLLVALDHRQRQTSMQALDGVHQQRGLAGAGTGHQVQREDAVLLEVRAVLRGIIVVLCQDVALDLHHARLGHARRMAAGGTEAEVQQAVGMVMLVMMVMGMHMAIDLAVLADMLVFVGAMPLDMDLTRSATACSTHKLLLYSTSNSLTRISVPPVACT